MKDEVEKDNLLKLPADNAVRKIQFRSNHEVIDRFCVEIVLDNKEANPSLGS